MHHDELSRRDFERLAMAAFGGMLLGTSASEAKDVKEGTNPLLAEPHICRGLNTCKDKDNDKKNACAGQGACHTVKAHECKGMNACKGEGGCGEHPGENKCKGMGECAVPLKETTWKKARKRFEELMKKEGKEVGPAPPAPKK